MAWPHRPVKSFIGLANIFGTMLPVLFVWNLPSLAKMGIANEFGDQCDATGVNMDARQPMGHSVSNYIATARATGMMAGFMFWPCLQMWLNVSFLLGRETNEENLATNRKVQCSGLACKCGSTSASCSGAKRMKRILPQIERSKSMGRWSSSRSHLDFSSHLRTHGPRTLM